MIQTNLKKIFTTDFLIGCLQKIISVALFLSILNIPAYAESEKLPPLPEGPLLLTSVKPEQLDADYWINRLPSADFVIKTKEQIRKFNGEIRQMVPEQKDVFQIRDGSMRSIDVKNAIESAYQTIQSRKLFNQNGKIITKNLYANEIKPLLNLETFEGLAKIRWGTAVRETSVRALPTYMKMIEGPDDVEFDQLQFTLIKLWTPVVIYHASSDGKWYYIQAPFVRGWVVAQDIALFSSKQRLRENVESKSFLVVTGESVPICQDIACGMEFFERTSMGTVLPLLDKTADAYVVPVPQRLLDGSVTLKKGYVSIASDVEDEFPLFTQANIIRQAFKLLGARYGWGGMYKGRDCSGFTQDIFLSFGIAMPRDSRQQAFVGTPLGYFEPFESGAEKLAILEHMATPALTLLRMPLHLMLYLGEVDGKHYVIHSTWAERIGHDPAKDEKRRINQVVVSDLSLNGNSYLGDLFGRTIQMNEVN